MLIKASCPAVSYLEAGDGNFAARLMFNWKFSNEIWPGRGRRRAGLLLSRAGQLSSRERCRAGVARASAMFINAGIPKCYNGKHHERRGELMQAD